MLHVFFCLGHSDDEWIKKYNYNNSKNYILSSDPPELVEMDVSVELRNDHP